MPRQARKQSESGIYHIMLRGIDRQQIFEDDSDNIEFLNILQKYRRDCGFALYAYCLMGNHIHLLLKPQADSLETIFKKIGGRYVYYYNVKYQRAGHLFQDRFKSEPVENDAYFLTVLRYIHQNPVRAEYCKAPEAYPYSSYNALLSDSDTVDGAFVMGLLPPDEFIAFHKKHTDDKCLDITQNVRRGITDAQVKAYIEKYAHCQTLVAFQNLDQHKRNKYIKKLYEKGGSIRQLSRLTGISKGIVEKIVY